MNAEQTPLEDLQRNSAEERLTVAEDVGTEGALGPLISDVNENKVDGEENETLARSEEDTMIESRDVQDSLNNNENCNLMCGQLSCKKGCEDSERTVVESFATATQASRELATAKAKRITGRRSNRTKKNCNGKPTGYSSAGGIDSNFTESAHELSTPESNASLEQRNQKHLRQSLFSIIREEFEQTEDVRMLPTCLHQIAETYFQEEDYEKAMQFIQLERIYHEQLLANLSAIQEQWETKRKTSGSTPLSSTKNSEKGLSSNELEILSNLCGSHQDPKICKQKLSASETSLRISRLSQLMGSNEIHDVGDPADNPDRESGSGSKPRKAGKPGEAAMTENSPPDVRAAHDLDKVTCRPAVLVRDHMEQQQQLCSFGLTPEAHTQSTGTVGRANPGSFSSGDAGKNNNLLQPEATLHCKDVSGIDAASKDLGEEESGKPMVDKLISEATDRADSGSGAQDNVSEAKSSLDRSSPIQAALEENNAAEHCEDVGEGDAKESPPRKADSFHAKAAQEEACKSPQSSPQQKCPQETDREVQRQAAIDFIASLLNGGVKDTEDFLTHLDFQEETLSEEEMSPSPGDTVLGDNLLSLDELAKRIEVEEVNPAAGLVSILKRRNGGEGEKFAQPPQKQAKRKVRFQEMEDVLDQEEIGGGSCILLIVLCILTVFLSVGGTALYCAFADVESSVCKDFASNVDFYYTQLLQGIEELKHWLFVT
ncbi:hypothetical protein FKM82_010758 [Ascaphus truei]